MTDDPLVRRLLPSPAGASTLPEAFAFAGPPGTSTGGGRWVRAVFVASVDGAATLFGHAGGLGNETDRQLFALNRALADVILVGAGTARIEGYGPAEDDPQWRGLRAGRSATAPLAVVSGSLDLDFGSALFAAAPEDARTIVITCTAAPAEALRKAEQVAEVIVAGDDSVDLTAAVRALESKRLRRIVCEGGPRLFADLLAAGEVDELCLTRSPSLVAGIGPNIVGGEEFDPPLDLGLDSIHTTDDGFLYLRYHVGDR